MDANIHRNKDTTMIIFKNQWRSNAFKTLLQNNWVHISHDEANEIGGDPQKLISILQFDYGYPKKIARRRVNEFWSLHAASHS